MDDRRAFGRDRRVHVPPPELGAVDMEPEIGVEPQSSVVRPAELGVHAAQFAHQGHSVERLERHHVDGGIELVRALRRTTRAFVELRIAIDRDGFDRADDWDHMIADIAQRLDHVRPLC